MNKYKRIKIGGRSVDEHRLAMERLIGRRLGQNEVVHHIDGDKSNNDLTNLVLMSRSDHARMHMKGVPRTDSEKRIAQIRLREYWHNRPSKYDKAVEQLDSSGIVVSRFRSTREAERRTGHRNSHIVQCCNGKRKTHHGYFWRYAIT